MNYEIPSLWLWVSGVFFLFGIVAFGATLVVLYKIMQMAEELKPKVESLTERVESVAVKVDRLADEVEETLGTVRRSFDGFGGQAHGILGSIEAVTSKVAGKLDGLTPLIMAAVSVYRIVTRIRAGAQPSKESAAPAKTRALSAKAKR